MTQATDLLNERPFGPDDNIYPYLAELRKYMLADNAITFVSISLRENLNRIHRVDKYVQHVGDTLETEMEKFIAWVEGYYFGLRALSNDAIVIQAHG